MKEQFGGRAFLGGQSYGGRQASILAASEPSLVDGLLLLSYPLHPPGRPNQLRTEHFPNLRIPMLFVSGTKDAFGSTEELEAAINLIPATTKLVAVPGAGHGLLTKANQGELLDAIAGAFRETF
jgi:predicted alpha/beta-hydrolase family hydrolase